jgi:dienelactone hydrolase
MAPRMKAINLPLMFCLIGTTMTSIGQTQGKTPPFYPEKHNLLIYQDDRGAMSPVKNIADWQRRRAHILANMQLVMGELPSLDRRVPPDVQVAEEVSMPKCVRKRITFAVEKDDRVPAYLLVPKNLPRKVPGMLCLHQTVPIGKGEPAGIGGLPNLHYAQELAARGYVTLAPDYPNYGDYRVDAYARGYASATMKGMWNDMRAVDLLQSLPEVDAECIGCIGHSLGGHNSLFVAAFDERIKVVVTSCGFNSFFKYYGGNLAGWSHTGYMPRIASVYGKDPRRMPFDFTEVLAAIAPRPLFINAPMKDGNFEVSGVQDCVDAAQRVYALFGSAASIVAVHPQCGHDFPPEARDAAYAFVDSVFRRQSQQ